MHINDVLNLNNLNLIDIRDNTDYQINHIEGSINIPYKELLLNHNKYLSKQKTYHIICYKGYTSNNLSNYLNKLGYNTVSIIGGYASINS